MSNCKDWKES